MKLVEKLPPIALRGPKPAPLLGATGNVLKFFGDPIGTLRELRTRGEVVPFTDRDANWIAVFGPERLRQVLSDARLYHNNSDIPLPVPPGSAPTRLNTALTSMNGEVHRRQRRMMMPAFGKQAVAGYRDEMVAVIDRVLPDWQPGPVDVAELATELALCIAMQTLYGLDVRARADELGLLSRQYLDGMLSVGAQLLPFRIPGTPFQRFLSVADRFEARLRELIAERRAQPEARRDVLSTLIHAHDDDGSTFTETELVGQAAVLLIASHETSANTIAWTLFLLAQHPDVYAELLDELASALGGGAPTVEQLASLPLLDAVVKESQRLLPASAILFFRRSTEPAVLDGIELPARANLVMSPLIDHRDPARFPEPQRFLPSRWRGLEPSPYEYLPFGAGPRLCIGATFASQAIRVALAVIVQRWRFQLADGARVSRKIRGITLGPKHGLAMIAHPQDRAFTRPGRVRGDIGELVDLPS